MLGNRLSPVVPAIQALISLSCLVLSGYVIPNYPAVWGIQGAASFMAIVLAILLSVGKGPLSDSFRETVTVLTASLVLGLSILEIRFFLPRVLDADPVQAAFYVLLMAQGMVWCFAFAYVASLFVSLSSLALTLLAYLFLYFKLSSGGLFLLFFLIVFTLGGFGVFRMFAFLQAQHMKEKAWLDERARLYGELENAEARLLQEERRHAAVLLSAELVHEVQNPINYMAGNLQFLEENIALLTAGKTAEEDRLRLAEDSASILSRFREGLELISVALGRARTGTELAQERRTESIDPEPIIRRAIEEIRAAKVDKAGKKIDFTVDCSAAGLFSGDEQDLFIIVKNLIQNGVEAIDVEGDIGIRAENSDGTFSLSVRDSGTGISEEVRKQLFTPFYTTKSEPGHLGVGLSLSRKIMLTYEGELSLSAAPSRGTIATARFPPRRM